MVLNPCPGSERLQSMFGYVGVVTEKDRRLPDVLRQGAWSAWLAVLMTRRFLVSAGQGCSGGQADWYYWHDIDPPASPLPVCCTNAWPMVSTHHRTTRHHPQHTIRTHFEHRPPSVIGKFPSEDRVLCEAVAVLCLSQKMEPWKMGCWILRGLRRWPAYCRHSGEGRSGALIRCWPVKRWCLPLVHGSRHGDLEQGGGQPLPLDHLHTTQHLLRILLLLSVLQCTCNIHMLVSARIYGLLYWG